MTFYNTSYLTPQEQIEAEEKANDPLLDQVNEETKASESENKKSEAKKEEEKEIPTEHKPSRKETSGLSYDNPYAKK